MAETTDQLNDQIAQDAQNGAPPQLQLDIQRLYVKDCSFEAPHVPQIFLEEWKPELNLDLNIQTAPVGQDMHEVVLRITATVKVKDKVAYLVEIHQGGIFSLQGFDTEQLKQTLGIFCPNLLYPYARAAISAMVNQGGFPPLYLAPINFEMLYQQHQQNPQQ